MDYALTIPDYNVQAHTDLEREIQTKKNGLLTFTMRIAGGAIRDLSLLEYVESRGEIKGIIETKLTVAHIVRTGNTQDAIR